MRHILAELEPLDPTTGERVTLRASSADLREITGMNDQRWWPAISELPTRSISLFDGDFSAAISLGGASITVQIDRLAKLYPDARRLYWPSAKVRIYRGAAGDAWPWENWFPGVVDKFDSVSNQLRLTLKINTEPFETDVLNRSYAGTGGAEGGDDIKGQPKPLIFGRARNVEPVLIDPVNSVFQFSGYGPIQAVNALFERASSFGPPTANYASYAALAAAPIAPGRWATCLAEGLVRLGAPPAGLITGDVDGHKVGATWPRRTGAIIAAVAEIADADEDLIDAASLAALDAAQPVNVNIVLTEQTDLLSLAQRLARGVNAQAGVNFAGQLFATRVSFGHPVATLDAQGRQIPRVTKNTEADVSPPYARIAMGAERNWRVHSLDEIASPYTLRLAGSYDPTRIYRQGMIVEVPGGDGEAELWEYINATPAAGITPVEGVHWTSLGTGLSGLPLFYSDGVTPVDYLRPAEPDATNTADPGSAFGGRTVGEVEADILQAVADAAEAIDAATQLALDLLESQVVADIRQAALEDLTHIGDEELKGWTKTRVDAIGVYNELLEAMIISGDTVLINEDGTTLLGHLEEISVSITDITEDGGTIDARISDYDEILTSPTGAIATSVAGVRTEVNEDIGSALIQMFRSQSDDSSTRATALTTLEAFWGITARAAAETLYETVIGPDGVNAQAIDVLSASFASLDSEVGTIDASITDMRQILIDPSGGVAATAVLALDVDGKIVGRRDTNDGTFGVTEWVFDSYNFLTPTGGSIFFAIGDTVHMPNVVVDTLEVNTAIVPKRAQSSVPVAGTHSTGNLSTPTPFQVIAVNITLPVAGIIDVLFYGQHDYAGDSQYQAQIWIGGVQPPEGVGGNGFGPRDGNFLITGSRWRPAGTYTVEGRWNGNTDLQLIQRALRVYGYPATSNT